MYSKEDLKEKLSKEAYRITQENGTEAPYSHPFHKPGRKGIYVDVVSGEALFSSTDQYDAGCGWPSFTRTIEKDGVVMKEDYSFGMERVEVRSKLADSHLGHVFGDGPREEGGLRYCINGAALVFVPYEELEEKGYGRFKELFEDK